MLERLDQVPGDMAGSCATVLVACCPVPAFFLPRKPAKKPDDPAGMMGH